MIFNSIEFFTFFVIFFALYWFVLKEKKKLQNILLLLGSYVFYAWADWKILPLLIISTLVFYGLGIAIFQAKEEKRKSLYSILGVVTGLAVLVYFKYTNFFISSFKELFDGIGLQTNLHTFKIIMPVGISFYTFRLMSYVIDIQRGKYEPTRDFVAFATYIAFFPCILAGPIDRPHTLIPQLEKKRVFDYSFAVDGCRQILWGLFAKVVVADNCEILVRQVWNSYETHHSGSILLLAAFFFVFQMYADFSGYSNMAIGVGKLLGIKVTQNFNYPLFAQNIADFWRRWHISLTSWLTDYVFMPLNIRWRDWGKWGMILAILITFALIGLWHGSNWTFALFGLYHGLLYIPLILSGTMFKKVKIETNKYGLPGLKTTCNMLLTFVLVSIGLILFRAETVHQAFDYIVKIFSLPFLPFHVIDKNAVFMTVVLLVAEWTQRKQEYALQIDRIKSPVLRWSIYYAIIVAISLLGTKNANQFIYFQF